MVRSEISRKSELGRIIKGFFCLFFFVVVVVVFFLRIFSEAGRMAQWVMVLAANPDDLSLIPGIQVAEGKN